jgi:hypothetical protein
VELAVTTQCGQFVAFQIAAMRRYWPSSTIIIRTIYIRQAIMPALAIMRCASPFCQRQHAPGRHSSRARRPAAVIIM